MARWLKTSIPQDDRAAADGKVRVTVEALLQDIEARGDEAVDAMSEKFDGWRREDYRLTDREVRDCVA